MICSINSLADMLLMLKILFKGSLPVAPGPPHLHGIPA